MNYTILIGSRTKMETKLKATTHTINKITVIKFQFYINNVLEGQQSNINNMKSVVFSGLKTDSVFIPEVIFSL